jgi:leucyl aminopeptidase
MEFTASSANLLKIKADCLIVLADAQINGVLASRDIELHSDLTALAKATNFDGKTGSSKSLHTPTLPFSQVILIGITGATSRQKQIKVIADAASKAIASGAKKILWVADEVGDNGHWQAAMVARNVLHASYKYAKK